MGTEMKVIRILAGAYTLFIVAPVTWLLWDNILKDRSFGNIFGLVFGFAMITVPFWGFYALRKLYFYAKPRLSQWIHQKQNARTLPPSTVSTVAKLSGNAEVTPIVDTTFLLSQIRGTDYTDDVARKAVQLFSNEESIYISALQRKAHVDFSTADKALQILRDKGYIIRDGNGPYRWSESVKPSSTVLPAVIIHSEQEELTEQEKTLISTFRKLSVVEQAQLLVIADGLLDD